MIIDKLLSFAEDQTVTGGTTTIATNDIDTQVARSLGNGTPLYLVVVIKGVANGDSGDTFSFTLVDDTELPIDQSSRAIASSPTITGVANIPAGTVIVVPVPPRVALSRYLGLRYAVTADAVLTVDAFLTDQPPFDSRQYAAA